MNNSAESNDYRCGAAHHESGHSVLAILNNWRIKHEGIDIDTREHISLECRAYDSNISHRLPVNMAGYLSESKFRYSVCHPLNETELSESIWHFLDNEEQYLVEDFSTDLTDCFYAMKNELINCNQISMLKTYRFWEDLTTKLLDEYHYWSAVSDLAENLIIRGKISGKEATAIILPYI